MALWDSNTNSALESCMAVGWCGQTLMFGVTPKLVYSDVHLHQKYICCFFLLYKLFFVRANPNERLAGFFVCVFKGHVPLP